MVRHGKLSTQEFLEALEEEALSAVGAGVPLDEIVEVHKQMFQKPLKDVISLADQHDKDRDAQANPDDL